MEHIVLSLALLAQALALLWASRQLGSSRESILTLVDEVRAIRISGRTRIASANTRNVPLTEEDRLRRAFGDRRVSRASVGKRVVVGGDVDSELHRSLILSSLVGRASEDDDDR